VSGHKRMLPKPLRLEAPGPNGIAEDVEGLCRAATVEMARRNGLDLEHCEFEDTVRHLLGCAIELQGKYDPEKRRGTGSFEGYLYDRLRWRALDYWRSPAGFGRAGQHRPLGADGRGLADRAAASALDDEPAGGHRPEPASTDYRDDPASGAAALEGFLALGDSGDLGALGGPGLTDRLGVGRAAAAGDGPARVATARAGRELAPAHVDCEQCGWRTYLQAPNGVTAWHVPDWCSACGAAIGLQGAEVAA
jgi:hypothetical protein